MIKVNNLSKSFNDKLVLNNISSNFEKGKVYGLLGRNGAGKTTFLRILANSISNYKGSITFNGDSITENQIVTEKIIYIANDTIPSTFDSESIKSIYKWARMLLPNWDESYKEKLVKAFNINTKSKYKSLSQGNKNIVNLILGLAANTEVIFFDEPSTGLDANNRYKFYKILLDHMEERESYCIISTHIIDEAEKVFEEVKILENGKFILEEELSTIQEKALVISGREDVLDEVLKNKNILASNQLGGVKILSIYDELSDTEGMKLKENNVDIRSISLQDLFVLLTEKEER